MKVLKNKFLGVLMALFMAFCCVFAGWSGLPAMDVKAETTVVELTYKSMQFQNNTENAGSYWTSVCFYPSVGDGVSSGNASGAIAADFSDLLAKTTYSGSDNSIIYSAACHWGWATDTKSSTFSFIYLRTVNAPALDDTIQMKSGAWFVTGGNIDDKYVLAEDINLKFNGTAWEYYVPVVDNTQWITEFTNNGQFVVSNYGGDAISYPYEIIDGETAGLPAGYAGAVAKIGSKINGGAAYINVDFTASQIAAAQVESVVARVYTPDYTADDLLRINNATGSVPAYNLSTWCDVELPLATITGADGNLGSFAFGLRDKGTISDYFYIDSITVNMVKPVVPVPVTFTNINSSWNNNSETLGNGMYYTILHLDGLLTSGYYTQGDDWSEMKANATINGGESYFNFCPASFIAGPDVAANFIILYTATAPTAGDEFFLPAGTTFKVGGNDTNIYQLTNDIHFIYNGTAWAEPVKATYSVYESTDPEIIHNYSTYQNEDGTFTYTLPEYTRENKVLLGYVENRMVGETLQQTFIPSGEYTTDATGLTFIALWGEFTTIDGASIRISSAETSGIRWTTTIDAEGFNNIAYWAKASYTFGTELSADGFSENFDIVANKWKVENSTYTGVLIDITSNYYDVEFTARGYVDITYANGVTKRIYAQANDTTRSIRQVAELAIASGDYSGSQLAVLEEIANA